MKSRGSKAASERRPPRLRLSPAEVDRRLKLVARFEKFAAGYVKGSRKRPVTHQKTVKGETKRDDHRRPSRVSLRAEDDAHAAWSKKILREAALKKRAFRDQPLEAIRKLRIAKGLMGEERLRRAMMELGQARAIALAQLYRRTRARSPGRSSAGSVESRARTKAEVDRLIDRLLADGFPAGRKRRHGADLAVPEFYKEIDRLARGSWYACLHHLVVALRRLKGRWPDLALAFEGAKKSGTQDAGDSRPAAAARRRQVGDFLKEFQAIKEFLAKVSVEVEDTISLLGKALESPGDEEPKARRRRAPDRRAMRPRSPS